MTSFANDSVWGFFVLLFWPETKPFLFKYAFSLRPQRVGIQSKLEVYMIDLGHMLFVLVYNLSETRKSSVCFVVCVWSFALKFYQISDANALTSVQNALCIQVEF